MTAPVLLQPMPQFSDANGKPYVGGLLSTYVKGTFTPKTTWKDPDQVAVNTNPITLDGAGRCSMWGDGDYQLLLQDAAGNQIWSQPATSIVSAAMYPVTTAPTTLDAMNYLGVTAAIAAEASARHAEIVTATGTVQANLDAFIVAQGAYDAAASDIVSESVTNLEAVDASLQAQISALAGTPVITAIGGTKNAHFGIGVDNISISLTFPTPFPTACQGVTVTPADLTFLTFFSNLIFSVSSLSRTGATITVKGLGPVTPAAFDTVFNWVATGY
jgi:hypothetical protein